MSDDVWKRQEIESPCIKVCVIDRQSRLCTGCLRSIDEITAWTRMTPADRRQVMAALPSRARLLMESRSGRLGNDKV